VNREEFEARYLEVAVTPDKAAEARTLGPIAERQLFGRSQFIFDGLPRERLALLGDVRNAGLADVFVAVVGAVA
jgi:ABC-2 type transport system ATP-binding protein